MEEEEEEERRWISADAIGHRLTDKTLHPQHADYIITIYLFTYYFIFFTVIITTIIIGIVIIINYYYYYYYYLISSSSSSISSMYPVKPWSPAAAPWRSRWRTAAAEPCAPRRTTPRLSRTTWRCCCRGCSASAACWTSSRRCRSFPGRTLSAERWDGRQLTSRGKTKTYMWDAFPNICHAKFCAYLIWYKQFQKRT